MRVFSTSSRSPFRQLVHNRLLQEHESRNKTAHVTQRSRMLIVFHNDIEADERSNSILTRVCYHFTQLPLVSPKRWAGSSEGLSGFRVAYKYKNRNT